MRLYALFLAPMLALAAVNPASLEKLCREELKRTQIPGVAVSVIERDRVSFARGFGTASLETHEAVSADHLFRSSYQQGNASIRLVCRTGG